MIVKVIEEKLLENLEGKCEARDCGVVKDVQCTSIEYLDSNPQSILVRFATLCYATIYYHNGYCLCAVIGLSGSGTQTGFFSLFCSLSSCRRIP